MKKGTVLLHKKFRFTNGQIGTKFLIILNSPAKDDPFLVCRTTSNPDRKPIREGCHSERNLFVINPGFDFFLEKTWVQFHEIFEFKAKEFLSAHFKGDLEINATLRDQTIRAIINCVTKSPDISSYHLELLKKK